MSYPLSMQESIQKVEATRPRRLSETFPPMNAEEKQALLASFHPDYRPAGFREIRVGPNAGEKAMSDLADILEGRSRCVPGALDLGQVDYETDVLVIGGGGAGASAALLARENGAKVILAANGCNAILDRSG